MTQQKQNGFLAQIGTLDQWRFRCDRFECAVVRERRRRTSRSYSKRQRMSEPSSPVRAPKPEPTCPGAPKKRKADEEHEADDELRRVLVINNEEPGESEGYLIAVASDAPDRLKRLCALRAGLKYFTIAVNDAEHQSQESFWDEEEEDLDAKHEELLSYFTDRFTTNNKVASRNFDVVAIFVLVSV